MLEVPHVKAARATTRESLQLHGHWWYWWCAGGGGFQCKPESKCPNTSRLRDADFKLGICFLPLDVGGCRVEAYLKTAALSEKDAGGGLPALNVAISAHAVASFGVGLGMLP